MRMLNINCLKVINDLISQRAVLARRARFHIFNVCVMASELAAFKPFHCNCCLRRIRHGHRCRWFCCYYYYGKTSTFTFCLLRFLLRFPFLSFILFFLFVHIEPMVPFCISFVPCRTLLVEFIEHETTSRKCYSAWKITQKF